MPRSPRIVPVGTVCHVINRGNDRRQIFFEKDEYSAFVELLGESKRRYPIGIYAHQTLPNHFHLILEPLEDGAISAALHWIGTRSSYNYRDHPNARIRPRVSAALLESSDHERHGLSDGGEVCREQRSEGRSGPAGAGLAVGELVGARLG
jgi:REP element-mobilizing transposase RayT